MNRFNRFRQQLFGVRHLYSNPLDAQRAQVLTVLTVVIAVVLVMTFAFFQIPEILRNGPTDPVNTLISVADLVALVFAYRQIQRGKLNLAIWIVVGLVIIGAVQSILRGGPNSTATISNSTVVLLPVPIVLAGTLLSRRGMFGVSALTFLLVIIAAVAQSANGTPFTYIPAEVAVADVVTIILTLLVTVAILGAFLGSLQRIANESYQLTALRQWINQLGSDLSAIHDETTLLNTAITRIRQVVVQRFVEIYIINEDGNLVLPSGGTQRRKIIRSIEPNILAEAARTRTVLVTSLEDAPERHTHMAASTSYAAAVPIMVNDNLMGVLDFQDVQQFSANELESLQELAGLLALNWQRVRVTTDLQSRVDDQELTITRLQTQLQDFSRRQQQDVSEIWGGYIQGRGKQAIGYNLSGDSAVPVQASDLPGDLVNTLKTGQLEVSTQGNEQVVNVPIKFRDTNLGAMSFAVPADQPLNDRQIEVATIVAERLALALENTRLFEQSQSQAFRERKASEVATALIGATDVRVVLNMAAEQFKEALGAVNTRIYIQPETMMEPLAQTQQEQ
ncbi:MAG: GAF domain-containing protein [Anaerolineaceae bacterium]|nr:GAF domain-containing protein [Anaerolineaceae bacterium]